uniref:Uncharacterized protein n=1 Tax=Anguilla anguilla TaxID=7936 RepID=A0A0E9WYR9_ANGAN
MPRPQRISHFHSFSQEPWCGHFMHVVHELDKLGGWNGVRGKCHCPAHYTAYRQPATYRTSLLYAPVFILFFPQQSLTRLGIPQAPGLRNDQYTEQLLKPVSFSFKTGF